MPARKQRLARRPAAVEPHESTETLPLACCNEAAAVEFVEKMRWGDYPACVHCGGEDVYRMTDARTGGRNKRFLWRCRSCNRMFTARIGTVFEESRLELRHWCYAFWRASTSGEGVAAREIMRQCRTSYKTALFLMQRLRSAMMPLNAPANPNQPCGIVECDETSRGGEPRTAIDPHKGGHGTGAAECAMRARGGRGVTGVTTAAPLATEPGPAPKMLKLAGSWQANVAKALQGKRATGGRPGGRGQVAPDGGGVIPMESGRMSHAPFLDGADPQRHN